MPTLFRALHDRFSIPSVPLTKHVGTSRAAGLRLAALLALAIAPLASPAQDVLTHHYDNYRSGVQSQETRLTPANVNTKTFGRLFSLPVDGHVYAEPLWVGNYTMADGNPHNVLFVATEHDSLYAFDADGRVVPNGYYWHVNLLQANETTVLAAATGSTDIAPEIGITGTPVIDRAAGVLYVVSKAKHQVGGAITYIQRLHALSLATGQEMLHGPVVIQAQVPGTASDAVNGVVGFNPLTQNQRAALALADGSVWIAWASHGDNPPYHGWVLGYNASNLTQQTGVFSTTPNGSGGGIWMSGGGLSVDAAGNLYAVSGRGVFDANVTGGQDFSSTAFKLTPGPNGLSVASWFTPYNQLSLSTDDLDMGSSAATLIDNPAGPSPDLLVTSNKDGQLYLLDRDSLGGFQPNANQDLQDFNIGGSEIHQNFAFFNNELYFAPDGIALSGWTFNPSTGQFNTSPAIAQDSAFGCYGCYGSGATPSISANGTQNGIVWLLDNSRYNSAAAVLHAFDASLDTELYNSVWAANNRDQADVAIKFTTPTIANGFVYAGGGSSVTAYGLFQYAPPTTAVPAISPASNTETAPVSVTITDATPGATIYYTLDGSTPTTASAVYSTAIPVSASTVVTAFAAASGSQPSGTASTLYIYGTTGSVFTLNNRSSSRTVVMNGSAQIGNGHLELTTGLDAQAGSAYYYTPVKIANFNTTFDLQMTGAAGDGMTFVVQNDGSTALGATGGSLGYGLDPNGGNPGISPSAAVKFDLYSNAGEGSDSTGLYLNGAWPTLPAVDMSKSPINLHNGHIFQVNLNYNGQTLYETVTDSLTQKSFSYYYPVNLPALLGGDTAWVGFTGGTGTYSSNINILNWSYSVPPPLELPAASLASTVLGPALMPYSSNYVSSGNGEILPANNTEEWVRFTVNVPTSATYSIHLNADKSSNRGVMLFSIDGRTVNSAVDEYSPQLLPLNVNLGSVLLGAGNHVFGFLVTGKDTASTGFEASFGQLILIP